MIHSSWKKSGTLTIMSPLFPSAVMKDAESAVSTCAVSLTLTHIPDAPSWLIDGAQAGL